MLMNKQGGIDCQNCGHQEIGETKAELRVISEKLEWSGVNDPYCPECGHTVEFEDYVDE